MGTFQWHVAQVLSAYSCGAVADSHRSSHYQMQENLYDTDRQGQAIRKNLAIREMKIGTWTF